MGENLTPEKFPYPDKCSDVCDDRYLEKEQRFVVEEARNASDWYLKNTVKNKFWSKRIRFAIIIFIALGGIMPLIATLEILGIFVTGTSSLS